MLRSRTVDYVFVLFFSIFVFICSSLEAFVCLGEPVSQSSGYKMVAASYDWGLEADRIWIEQPYWSRVAVCYHAFFFGTFYFLFALGFLFRWKWIRIPVLCVCAAKLYAGAYYMTMNLTDPVYPPKSPALFVTQSCSYMVIPFLAMVRMFSSDPFPAAQAQGSTQRSNNNKRTSKSKK